MLNILIWKYLFPRKYLFLAIKPVIEGELGMVIYGQSGFIRNFNHQILFEI